MCGISGIAFNNPKCQASRSMLSGMTSIMRHRGPDGEGFFSAAGVGFGMCRLSIIDRVTGDQPISNEDGTVTVVCNGEIYNFIELRERLQFAGHHFRTRSDVEVIVHLYEDDPEAFLSSLRGMFGFALWDSKRHRLLLARDRLGIKPLHYAITPEGLLFGSELKTILSSGRVTPTLDRLALRDLFECGFIMAPKTLVTEIRRLRPGHLLTFEAGQIREKAYWDVSFPPRDEYNRSLTDDEWAEALREKLTESVRLHLRSDVSVGAWLSGGIDSSSVIALMSREIKTPIQTFTLGFENRECDEAAKGRLLDEYPAYNLAGHRTECRRNHIDLLPKAVWHREQPFGLGVDISRMLISEMTARHVKVVLTGEGSDEILGGYSWYWADKVLSPFASLPSPIRRLAAYWLSDHERWPGAGRILMAPAAMGLPRYRALIGGSRWTDLMDELFSKEGGPFPAQENREASEFVLPDAFVTWHPFAQLQFLDLKLRMAESVMQHLDLHSMAYSLEARVPFLDHPLVEFCASIPPRVKMRGLREKHVLRRAMRKILPREICQRKKFPLSAPIRDWMQGNLPDFAEELLSETKLRDKGLFSPAFVADLRAQHKSGRIDHSRLLMNILSTQLWEELFLKQFPTSTSALTSSSGDASCATA
jgi:asparagine synthase (glutamine-hydrolysing)